MMSMRWQVGALLVSILAPVFATNVFGAEDALPAPKDARVYFITPVNGAVVKSPVRVIMGLTGMGVAPAGVDREATGHHHLVIDAGTPSAGVPIPADDQHRHFGGGQTETRIELAPGTHTLQLVVGDLAHRPHEPPVASEVIRITVE